MYIRFLGLCLLFVLSNSAFADHFIYRDSRENNFEQWGWASQINESYSSNSYAGSYSTRVVYSSPWEGYFAGLCCSERFVDTHHFDAVMLKITAEGSSVYAGDIVLKLKDANGNDLNNGVSLWSYIPYSPSQGGAYINPGSWRTVVVPLDWLNGIDKDVSGLMIMSATGGNTILLDEIKFTHVGLRQDGTLYSDGLGLNVQNHSWATTFDAWAHIPANSSSTWEPHQGDTAFFAYFGNAWEGVKFHQTSPIGLTNKEWITLRVRSPNGSKIADLQAKLEEYNGSGVWTVDLGNYVTNPPSDEWIEITIHVDDFFLQTTLPGSRPVLESLTIMSEVAGVGTMYFDDVAVVSHAWRSPMPQSYRWSLTSQAGDYGCTAIYNPVTKIIEPSSTHLGNNWHSLDFDNVAEPGGSQANVSIYAAGDGYVSQVGYDSQNGYHVFIDHVNSHGVDDDYVTKYLHMKNTPSVTLGQYTPKGTVLGELGATGNVTGSHLHFQVEYLNNGSLNARYEIGLARIEGLMLQSYQTRCEPGEVGLAYTDAYYRSEGN